jgi:cytoskeletal protein CcmA (bactofilin family)
MKIFSASKIPGSANIPNAISSIIGQDMTIVGDLSFKSKIQVDGRLQGNLSGTCLVLSESGRIVGDVASDSLICYGQIDGNLTVGKLFLKKTGVINGRVETSDLSVESGGILNGEIKPKSQDLGLGDSRVAPASSPATGQEPPTLPHHDKPGRSES